jgi:hypothetical protein
MNGIGKQPDAITKDLLSLDVRDEISDSLACRTERQSPDKELARFMAVLANSLSQFLLGWLVVNWNGCHVS